MDRNTAAGKNATDRPAAAPRGDGAQSDKKRLSSVGTAVLLLKTFSEDQPELGISMLSRRLGIAKSTVHRLAATLVAEGLLEQDAETEKYRLGIGLFRLGALVRRRMTVSNEARPFLYALREKTNETVQLAILDGTEIMFIFNLESTQAIHLRADLGVRRPAYCTAAGQAILAFQPAETVAKVIAKGLTALTPQTVTDAAALHKTLRDVRQRGCAVEDEESEIGMRSISAPIRNDAGDVVAAIGTGGPVTRLSRKAITALIPHVIASADEVSQRLGYRPGVSAQRQR
ncbi:MAG TPA: IclR family transcriptional regulator [Xanthobacteraceae bacterium]|nr:IclR family transcriptional regulator [Xanthobacteraceae bacterium]